MDGVEDMHDKCPYTPFSDLVGSDGCTVESLLIEHHFDIATGVSYSDTDYNTLSKTDTITTALYINYYYKNFSFNFNASYYNNESQTYSNSGMNDTFIGLDYTLVSDDLLITLGGGVILPTYETTFNNNNTDYTASINLSYGIENLNLFLAYGYTIVNDDDIENIASYQNSSFFSGGLGYYMTSKVYMSLAYNSSDSIYKEVQKVETASAYLYYSLDGNFFTTMSYAYGLSESASDNYLSIKLGYYH